MSISDEDKNMLLDIIATDPDFVDQYLGSENPFFNVKECAKALNLCERSIVYRITTGSLKAERNSDGRYQISAKNLQDHIRQGGTKKGFSIVERSEKEELGETQMKTGSYTYDKSSSQNVLDFLTHWEKANVVGFSLKTVTNDFNKVCATKTTEGQMSGILSTLTRKKILVRRGRGIYCLADGFRPSSPPIHAVPVVAVNETAEEFHEEAEETTFREREELKTEERHLVDKFLSKFASPTEDFTFTISSLVDHYPRIDRKKLGKVVNNMYQNGKLAKGSQQGEYIKKATKKSQPTTTISTPEPDFSRAKLSEKLEKVIDLDIPAELKAKVIAEMMK